ncbi:MAG: MFS transporter, partial [Caulobacteraceae bacterium]
TRGWFALLAVFVFQAAIAGAGMYIVPLALQSGLSSGVAQTAIALTLALEVLGGLAATAISGRANFLDVLLSSGLVLLGALAVYALRSPAWLFIGASGAIGFCALLVMPFVVPMTIKADPSRRAAVQLGGAQLLGGAIGPVMASLVVTSHNAHGALVMSAAMLVASLAVIFGLNRSQGPRQHRG